MDGHPPSFRKWSVLAFATESVIAIFAFLFMIVFLKWEINATMMYLLLLVMVLSAVLLLVTGRHPWRNDRIRGIIPRYRHSGRCPEPGIPADSCRTRFLLIWSFP